MLGLLGVSVELVVRVSTYGAHNRTAALLDRETGPVGSGLCHWQSSCAPRSRASLRNVSTKLNSTNSINKMNV
jgi:hypothetical protein